MSDRFLALDVVPENGALLASTLKIPIYFGPYKTQAIMLASLTSSTIIPLYRRQAWNYKGFNLAILKENTRKVYGAAKQLLDELEQSDRLKMLGWITRSFAVAQLPVILHHGSDSPTYSSLGKTLRTDYGGWSGMAPCLTFANTLRLTTTLTRSQ